MVVLSNVARIEIFSMGVSTFEIMLEFNEIEMHSMYIWKNNVTPWEKHEGHFLYEHVFKAAIHSQKQTKNVQKQREKSHSSGGGGFI